MTIAEKTVPPDADVSPIGPQQMGLTNLVTLLVGIFVVFVALEVAQDFFSPVLAAFVLGVVLTPMSRLWRRMHMNHAMAALTTLVLVLVALAFVGLLFEPYVTEAVDRAPSIWRELKESIEDFRQMLRGLEEISEDVAASVDPESVAKPAAEAAIDMPSATDALFYAPKFVGQAMIFSGTLYFFLLARGEIYAWIGVLVRNLTRSDFEYAEAQVARYFLTVTAINAVLGLIVGAAMYVIGLPAAGFWGLLAFLLNFIPYLGPVAVAATLAVAGLVAFDGPYSLAPVFTYLMINTAEGQFITPALVGQQMRVNPLLVFLALVFWLWLWGPIGGIIAIPLMVWTIAMTEAIMGHTISSGMPGILRPNLRAGLAE